MAARGGRGRRAVDVLHRHRHPPAHRAGRAQPHAWPTVASPSCCSRTWPSCRCWRWPPPWPVARRWTNSVSWACCGSWALAWRRCWWCCLRAAGCCARCSSRSRTAACKELFTLAVLLVVLASAWLTEHAGLSLALGGFLAGMMLAETEYRHQVEAVIRPFRELLLGLFFISVGMLLDIRLVYQQFPLIVGHGDRAGHAEGVRRGAVGAAASCPRTSRPCAPAWCWVVAASSAWRC